MSWILDIRSASRSMKNRRWTAAGSSARAPGVPRPKTFSRVGLCESQVRLPELLSQARQAGRDDRRGRAEVLGDPERDLGIEDVIKAFRVTWHERMKMFMHLLLDCDLLADQVAAVPGQQLETDEDRVGVGFEQTEAVDCGAVDGGEVGVIGLVAGVGGLPELLGGERVDDADLRAGPGEGALDGSVVAACAIDGNDVVLDAVPVQGLVEKPTAFPRPV